MSDVYLGPTTDPDLLGFYVVNGVWYPKPKPPAGYMQYKVEVRVAKENGTYGPWREAEDGEIVVSRGAA